MLTNYWRIMEDKMIWAKLARMNPGATMHKKWDSSEARYPGFQAGLIVVEFRDSNNWSINYIRGSSYTVIAWTTNDGALAYAEWLNKYTNEDIEDIFLPRSFSA